MESDERAVTQVLRKSGLRNWMGLVGGFRFAQGIRFKGTSMATIYLFYEICTEFVVIIAGSSLCVALLSPGLKMVERCFCVFPMVTCIFCLFTSNYPRFKRRAFATLVDKYDNAFPNTLYRDHLEDENKKAAEHVRFITMVLLLLEFVPMVTFCVILPILNEATGFAFGPRKLPFPTFWPWDPLVSFRNFIFTLFFFASGSIFVALKKLTFEESFFIFASRQIALFKHLRYNLERIFDPLELNDDGTVNMNELTTSTRYLMKMKLKQWVKDHQSCLSSFYELEALYEWTVFVYFGVTTLILCTSTYITSDKSANSQEVVACGFLTVAVLCQLFFICRMGDLIKIETEELLRALSGKNAFLFNSEEFKYLKIIMTRCQRESTIRCIGGFPLTISTFQSITTSSYSYYTMLKEMNGKIAE